MTPDEPQPEPLRPRLDPLPLAVAGTAQLVGLGAEVPRRVRTWDELVAGLLAAAAVAEALTGNIAVPAPIASRDGTTIPGIRARSELAHDPHTLAEWAGYMGNCIAGADYLQAAADGECVLAALRDPRGPGCAARWGEVLAGLATTAADPRGRGRASRGPKTAVSLRARA